jgi:hypothetical protein
MIFTPQNWFPILCNLTPLEVYYFAGFVWGKYRTSKLNWTGVLCEIYNHNRLHILTTFDIFFEWLIRRDANDDFEFFETFENNVLSLMRFESGICLESSQYKNYLKTWDELVSKKNLNSNLIWKCNLRNLVVYTAVGSVSEARCTEALSYLRNGRPL